ncbi:hypothetical protein [Halodesulfovibrio aestuarii]|uniref:Uncharacterized protein n=1 Tax=Halodesulfovibrio aestuarii TaxID=126333 RepID=A0A8G2C8F2_9BACT|nr:hypothetical protein [Halodesulfovibrio aestuarii]SHI80467.1 hypothetical protein SAMN05660830_01052 [Halodesulfovibrio aestuarii]
MSVSVAAEECETVEELDTLSQENMQYSAYTFMDVDANEQRKFDHMVLSESQVVKGGLVVFAMKSEKPRYYTVQSIDDEKQLIELVKPQNAIGKVVLLFALLGACWFVLDYIMSLFL